MKYLFVLLFLIITVNLNGQRQELLDDLSTATCECLQDKDLSKEFEMTMGLCAIQATSGRQDEIQELLDIDLSDLNQYEKLGELIGMNMIADCPVFMDKMMEELGNMDSDELDELMEDDEDESESWSDMEAAGEMSDPGYGGPENKAFITTEMEDTNGSNLKKPSVSGVVKSIIPGIFNEVMLKGNDGETHVLYLASPVANQNLLKKGAKITISYRSKSMYNAALKTTKPIKLITKIEK